MRLTNEEIDALCNELYHAGCQDGDLERRLDFLGAQAKLANVLTQPKDVKRPAADDCSLSVAELRRLVLERGGEIERLEKELEDWQTGRKERTAYMAKSYSKSFAAKAIFFRKRACELSAEIDTLKAALEQQGAQGWMPPLGLVKFAFRAGLDAQRGNERFLGNDGSPDYPAILKAALPSL